MVKRPESGAFREGSARGHGHHRRQAHHELASWPWPSLKAATLPPCISTSPLTRLRPMPNPPWRAGLGLPRIEEVRQDLRGQALAVVSDPYHPPVSRRSTVSQILASGSVYLAAFVRMLRKICSRRAGFALEGERTLG